MDINKYRKYVVTLGEPWEQVHVVVPQHLRLNRIQFEINGIGQSTITWNHPLVNAGNAYWLTDKKLCIGYRLKNKPFIFKPIFDYNRQRNIDQFQNNIKRVVEKREEKRAFIELFKIKRLPRVIVEKIIKIAY